MCDFQLELKPRTGGKHRKNMTSTNSTNITITFTQLYMLHSAGILFVIVFFTGVIGNFLICFVVYRVDVLRTKFNILVVNLAVVDLLTCLIAPPLSLATLYYHSENNELYKPVCYGSTFMGHFGKWYSLLIMTEMGVIRAACGFRRYRLKLSKRRLVELCVINFIVTGVFSIWRLLGGTNLCTGLQEQSSEFIFINAGIIMLLFIILTTGYLALAIVVRKRALRIFQKPDTSPTTRFDLPTIRASILIILSMAVCHLPYVVYAVVKAFDDNGNLPMYSYVFMYSITMLSYVSNPVIFCFTSKTFRHHLRLRLNIPYNRIRPMDILT